MNTETGMTDNKMRIAIAEACGWTEAKLYPHIIQSFPDILSGICPKHKCLQAIPDYLNDLNAMHEAEKTLDDAQMVGYSLILSQIQIAADDMWIFHATARQRAEAFLRVLSKWQEGT